MTNETAWPLLRRPPPPSTMNTHGGLARHVRACGPIALCQVLHSCGIETTVPQIVPWVTRLDSSGAFSARSYLLAAYAEGCGLEAVTLQSQPTGAWKALQHCQKRGLRVIVNHQAFSARDEGHFSVLMSVSEHDVTLHDPFLGPDQSLDRDLFLERWRANAEISGHVLIVIAPPRRDQACHLPVGSMPRMRCPRCNHMQMLSPHEVFRPDDWHPTTGMWRRFFCAKCDGAIGPAPYRRDGQRV